MQPSCPRSPVVQISNVNQLFVDLTPQNIKLIARNVPSTATGIVRNQVVAIEGSIEREVDIINTPRRQTNIRPLLVTPGTNNIHSNVLNGLLGDRTNNFHVSEPSNRVDPATLVQVAGATTSMVGTYPNNVCSEQTITVGGWESVTRSNRRQNSPIVSSSIRNLTTREDQESNGMVTDDQLGKQLENYDNGRNMFVTLASVEGDLEDNLSEPEQELFKDQVLPGEVSSTTDWSVEFHNYSVEFLTQEISDHSPVVLSFSDGVRCKPPFRFCNYWLAMPEFPSTLSEAWNIQNCGNPSFMFFKKLRNLKQLLKRWPKISSSNIQKNTERARKQLDSIQKLLQQMPFDVNLCYKEKEFRAQLCFLMQIEEEELRQKTNTEWLTYGDKGNSFFHNALKEKKNKNNVWVRRSNTLAQARFLKI
ncbi:hypothetical protein IFM89_022550 [Coptis chinensis]|uniref:Uncharacterized protein n=1 Tax=Coptis chinensis TaxID=261450 RepID=A0A835IGE9_9MAGN|nr:hypothetical protein IFM89_022550 [Coptis chinensis]